MTDEDIEEEIEEVEEQAPSGPTKPLFSMRRFVYIFLGVIAIMVIFDPDLRFTLGGILGTVLYPLIGFGGNYPVLTLICAGVMMISFSTVVRDFFMDWVEMAEIQKKTSEFQKELREAKMANQTTKVKKLEKMQPEVSKMSMKTMKPQMKSMAVTMIVIISIFGWIWTFVDSLPNTAFSVPWQLNADLTQPMIQGCFMPFPQWIGVYMLISVPLGQLLKVSLNMFEFKKKLKEGESSQE